MDRELIRRSLNISSLSNTFEDFQAPKGSVLAQTKNAFMDMVNRSTKYRLLLCIGGVGSGKTHLCEASSIALYRKGIFAKVISWARLIGILRRCMQPGSYDSADTILQRVCQVSHLILDDVGLGGSGSDWEFGQLEAIIDYRYRDNLFTIVTTNKALNELPPRVSSRFSDKAIARIVINKADDYRLKKGF